MNLSQFPLCLLCAVVGAGLVKVADHLVPDETVTAKRILVKSDDDKTVVQMDSSGVQVLAEDSDSYVRIKGQDLPQLEIIRDGATVASLGQNIRGTDGLLIYRDGGVAAAVTANESRSIVGIATPGDGQSAGTLEELLAGSKGFAIMAARSDRSEVTVSFGDSVKEMKVP